MPMNKRLIGTPGTIMTNKNQLTDAERKIGRFMVAIGAIIENEATGKILVVKRTDEFKQGEWEITYGRIDQGEDLDDGLRREVWEETGLKNVEIKRVVRMWHFYRGEKTADKEIHGLTFHCTVTKPKVQLSDEHSEYQWVSPEEAISLIANPGIKYDVKFWLENKDNQKIVIGGLGHTVKQVL